MKHLLVVSICALGLLLGSCTKVLDSDVEGEKQLVVECFLGLENDTIRLRLTQNRLINEANPIDPADLALPDAEVRMEALEQETVILSYNTRNKQYEALAPEGFLISGRTYRLNITHPQFPALEASTTMPAAVGGLSLLIDSLEVNQAFIPNDYFGTLTWNKPSGTTYHRALVSAKTLFTRRTVFPAFESSENDKDYVSLGANEGPEVAYPRINFQEDDDPNSFGRLTYPGDSVFYAALNIDENYYGYHLDLNRSLRADELADPVLIFSNIENGQGIFASYSIAKNTLRLGRD